MPDQRYEVGTDGRAPGELREACDELVLLGAATAPDAAAGSELARRLLACTTSLPTAVIDALGLPPGSSDAQAAEQLLRWAGPCGRQDRTRPRLGGMAEVGRERGRTYDGGFGSARDARRRPALAAVTRPRSGT